MRRALLAAALWLALGGPLLAGYDDGMNAYWRGDYATALREFRPLAGQSDASSQFMLGQLYAAGNGVLQDFVQAHLWYNLAAAGGNGRAAEARDELARRMTPTQVAEAQRQARAWQPSGPAAPGSLSESQLVTEIQQHLNTLGHDVGTPDGQIGWRTRAAIRSFQQQQKLPVDGDVSADLLARLRKVVAERPTAPAATAKAAPASAPAPKAADDIGDDNDDAAAELAKLTQGLKAALAEGRAKRLAEPAFLTRLEGLMPPAARRLVLSERFKDGDFSRNPEWKVASGSFSIDASGALTSTVVESSSSDRAADVLTSMLNQALGGQPQARQGGRTEIFAPVDLPGAFEVSATVRLGADSICEIGVFTENVRNSGYWLVLAPGQKPALLRRDSGKGVVLARGEQALPAAPTNFYTYVWRREAGGKTSLSLRKRTVMTGQDTTYSGPFNGVIHINRAGDCALRAINVVALD